MAAHLCAPGTQLTFRPAHHDRRREQQRGASASSSAAALPACRPCVRAFASADGDAANCSLMSAVDRRQALSWLVCGSALGLAATHAGPADAFTPPPPGFRVQVDKLDGYSFFYPSSWLPVTVTGNDCFFRNPVNIDENLFVDLSSPSSSFYRTVTDLGTPEQVANSILEQYLNKEFMSTRIGIKREGSILSSTQREGSDGRVYYDIAIRMTSYASRSPYVATQVRMHRTTWPWLLNCLIREQPHTTRAACILVSTGRAK
jgi:hypothetical protein